jgi:hypothetical protein
VSGVRGITFHPVSSSRWWLCCRCPLIQPPRIATLLQLRDSVIGDGETLVLRQTFFQTSYDLARAPQGESDRVSEDFSLRHWRIRT